MNNFSKWKCFHLWPKVFRHVKFSWNAFDFFTDIFGTSSFITRCMMWPDQWCVANVGSPLALDGFQSNLRQSNMCSRSYFVTQKFPNCEGTARSWVSKNRGRCKNVCNDVKICAADPETRPSMRMFGKFSSPKLKNGSCDFGFGRDMLLRVQNNPRPKKPAPLFSPDATGGGGGG